MLWQWWLLVTNERELFLIIWKTEPKTTKEHLANAEYMRNGHLLE